MVRKGWRLMRWHGAVTGHNGAQCESGRASVALSKRIDPSPAAGNPYTIPYHQRSQIPPRQLQIGGRRSRISLAPAPTSQEGDTVRALATASLISVRPSGWAPTGAST